MAEIARWNESVRLQPGNKTGWLAQQSLVVGKDDTSPLPPDITLSPGFSFVIVNLAPPTKNTDASPCWDFSHFLVYWGYSEGIDVGDPQTYNDIIEVHSTQHSINSDMTVYCVAVAVDKWGNRSDPSVEVSATPEQPMSAFAFPNSVIYSGPAPKSWAIFDISQTIGQGRSVLCLSVASEEAITVYFRPWQHGQPDPGMGIVECKVDGGEATLFVVTDDYGIATWKADSDADVVVRVVFHSRIQGEPVSLPEIPVGTILAWVGTEEDIPGGWIVCNGENGTPNLNSGVFPVPFYEEGITGGHTTHTVGSHTHSHTSTEHSHTHSLVSGSPSIYTSSEYKFNTVTHTHGSNDATHSHTIPGEYLPPYYDVIWIMYVGGE